MPMPRKPYIILVTEAVSTKGNLTGASIKLKNNTKVTDTTKISNESNSNVVMNLSNAGDWDDSDSLTIEVTKSSKTVSKDHTINQASDHGIYNFGSFNFGWLGKVNSISNSTKIMNCNMTSINKINSIESI